MHKKLPNIRKKQKCMSGHNETRKQINVKIKSGE